MKGYFLILGLNDTSTFDLYVFLRLFLATLVALHSTMVNRSVGRSLGRSFEACKLVCPFRDHTHLAANVNSGSLLTLLSNLLSGGEDAPGQ